MERPQNETFFISDLHLGHKAIMNFSRPWREGSDVLEHNEWIVKQWNSVVRKNDMVWVCGDVIFGQDNLWYLHRMHGHKNLVRGNHDTLSTATYLKYFNNVYGLIKVDRFWLSHAPIHPAELRGRNNIHGHVHHNSIPDARYINVSVENLAGVPISLTRLLELYYSQDGIKYKADEFKLPKGIYEKDQDQSGGSAGSLGGDA